MGERIDDVDLVIEPADQGSAADPASAVGDLLDGVSDFVSGVLDGSESPDVEDPAPSSNTVVIIQPETPAQTATEEEDRDVWEYDFDYGVQVYSTNPITSGTGLKGVLIDVLGPYDAIVVEHRYQNSNSSNYSYVREIQPDYPWLCSAAVFLALLWSVFAIGGRIICRK